MSVPDLGRFIRLVIELTGLFLFISPQKKTVPKKKNKKSVGNPRLNSILFNSSWQIDQSFAVAQLSRYLEEIALIEKGVPFEDLGIKQRRSSQQTKVFSFSSGSYIPSNPFALTDGAGELADPDPEVRINVDQPAPDLDPELEEVTATNVAHMKLTGTMFLEEQLSTRGVQSLVEDIRIMNADPSFVGAILEVDSGGGESLAGAALEAAVRESQKPIVAMVHMALSAAYRAIAYCDRIVAITDSSQFGSIGSMLKIDKFMAEVDKVQFLTIYASQSPDKNKEFRQFQDSGDTSGLQELVDEGAGIFQEVVRNARTLSGSVDETLAGGIFRTQEAIERGLADQTGGFTFALSQLQEVISISNNNNQVTQTIDMGLLSTIQSLFPGRNITDEASAEAVITELQEAANQEVTATEEVEETAEENTETPAEETPETVETPAEETEEETDEPEGQGGEFQRTVIQMLESQSQLLESFSQRLDTVEQAQQESDLPERMKVLAGTLNKMKLKSAGTDLSNVGGGTGEATLETGENELEEKPEWKFSETSMKKLYQNKKQKIFHSGSVN